MNIRSIEFKDYTVRFAGGFLTSRGVRTERRGTLVVLQANNELTGLGDIAPLEGSSRETLAQALLSAGNYAQNVEGAELPGDFSQLESMMSNIGDLTQLTPSASFGLQTAMADLASKYLGVPLCRWISQGSNHAVPVNAVIPGGIDDMRSCIEPLLESGFEVFKIKVGAATLDDDITRVKSIREQLGDRAVLRLDANAAWSFDQAVTVLTELADYGLEFVEEPLRESEMARLDELHAVTGVRFALDESVTEFDQWQRLIVSDAVCAVVLKPTIVGGLVRSMELCMRAHALGKKVIITSAFESGVGVAACLHVAASLGDCLAPCGLDTLRYMSDTLIVERFTVGGGRMKISDSAGLGVTLKEGVIG